MANLPPELLSKLEKLGERRRTPVSTYRLQLHQHFGFKDTTALLDYLTELGITDVYVSPILKAKPGSTHGYDICDHNALNPDLGSDDDFETLSAELKNHQLGLLVDFVPNHMGIDPNTNPWWRNVLENGAASPYAHFFDIDWNPLQPELKGKVLLPILGDLYGRVLERGELVLVFEDDMFWVRYFDTRLPINFHDAQPMHGQADSILQSLNGHVDDPKSFDALHALLETQAYRLASWKTAMHEINYRRFFDINTLAGLRMEDPVVFKESHALTLRLLAEGKITGLRLDHPDGLYDPSAYYEELQAAFLKAWLQHAVSSIEWTPEIDQALRDWRVAARKKAPMGLAAKPLYLVAEKILTGDEALAPFWMIDGTVGYGFLNNLTRLWVSEATIPAMKEILQRFTGHSGVFADILYESKKLIMDTSMASELQVLAQTLNRLSEADRRSRDYTMESLREALREIVACFPVYRTYINAAHASATDRAIIDKAVMDATTRNPATEPSIFRFIRDVLIPENADKISQNEFHRQTRFAMKFQQYTAPVQAKGMEDTAFYRYVPVMAFNEVGGAADPAPFDLQSFHQANTRRQATWPRMMLTTSTHDTKRGEDARARLVVLTEMAKDWELQVNGWANLAKPYQIPFGSTVAPSRYDQYSFFQALLGAWSAHPGEQSRETFSDRMSAYMLKMIRESKVHTSWISPNKIYEDAVDNFVRQLLNGAASDDFYKVFTPFAQHIAQAGALNSLAQVALKIAGTGVPDIYQGNELWNLDLVDPDNRRPVDYQRRLKNMAEMNPYMKDPTLNRRDKIREWLDAWTDGRIKQFVTAIALHYRREHPSMFLEGSYEPMVAIGDAANHVVAFGRQWKGESFLVVTPRWLGNAVLKALWPEGFAKKTFKNTLLELPDSFEGSFHNEFTGETLTPELKSGHPTLDVARVLDQFPVAFLSSSSL